MLKKALQMHDIFDQQSIEPVCCYDDKSELYYTLLGVPIIGPIDFDKIQSDYNDKNFEGVVIMFSGNNAIRKRFFDELTSRNIPTPKILSIPELELANRKSA